MRLPPQTLLQWRILGAVLAAIAPWTAWACRCSSPPDALSGLEQSAAVFRGRVMDITEAFSPPVPGLYGKRPYRRVRFTILDSYKGPLPENVIVGTGVGGGDCGFEFSRGETYLVFAEPAPNKYELVDYATNICSRTAHGNDATQDLALLGAQDSARNSILMMLGAGLFAALVGAWIIYFYRLRRRPHSSG